MKMVRSYSPFEKQKGKKPVLIYRQSMPTEQAEKQLSLLTAVRRNIENSPIFFCPNGQGF